jgi:inhibitor of cysteine peptidase
MSKRIFYFLLVLSLLLTACGSKATTLTEADDGTQIELSPGQTLTITLPSNPTTGYSWQVAQIDTNLLEQQGQPEYQQSPGSKDMVGAGGAETLRFKALGTGQTDLQLAYQRPWETGIPPIRTFSITVIVR